jgi:Predicted ATPase
VVVATGRSRGGEEERDAHASAVAAFALLESLTAGVAAAARTPGGQAKLPVLVATALRAALHPSLAPYRADPLLPLDGEFISLDARLRGLVAFAARQELLPSLYARLSPDDRAALAAQGLGEADAPLPLPREHATGHIGETWGTLYLTAERRAIACCVRALYAPSETRAAAPGNHAVWPAPAPVRPVSASVRESARDALNAALHVAAACSDELPFPIFPAPVWFDVCGAPDTVLQAVSGDSLGLALALAFLSALTGLPLPPDVAATGAVGGASPDIVRSVGHVPEKAAAVRSAGLARFFTPADGGSGDGVLVVETLREAARALSPDFARLLTEPADTGEIAPPAGGPDGVTLLATEIEGAARLWQTEPAAMRAAAADHARLVRSALARHRGYVFKERVGDGEGFLAAFERPEAACTAALAVQRALRRHPWPQETGPLDVRIAVHRGAADPFKGDYFGPALGQTRRVLEAGSGGQILVTGAARTEALGDEVRWSDLGAHRLRDLAEPVSLWQLSAPDLPEAFDPPSTLDSLRHNLPVQETPLLGRDAEVAMLSALLAGRSQRLITLLGPGGVGKTRLALQAAADAVESYPDGVYFVSVEEAAPTPEGVAAAVADALRLSGGSAGGGLRGDAVRGVLDALAGRRVLLVLDNFESVLPDGAGFVSRLLAQAPEVVCVVTSRALLLLSAERRFDVSPLSLPGPYADEDEVRAADAVALFCARARAARPDFDPCAEDDLRLLADVCRRLDGLPLALELAAARLRHLSLAELSERLRDAFAVLTTRLRDVPRRHRTLQGTLEWSYDLLDDDEKRMLRAVSIFAGGFSGRAAEAVSGESEALDLLASLEDKSLVVCRAEDAGASRFHLLNLVDEFAAHKLREAGEEETARAAHARWFAALAAEKGAAARTPDEVAAFDVLEAEMDNLRAAFAYLRDHTPEQLPEYVAALADFLRRRGYAHERREWPKTALEVIEVGKASPSDLTHSRLHQARSVYLRDIGDILVARNAALRALELGKRARDPWTIAEALNALGLLELRAGSHADAQSMLEEARSCYRRSNRNWGEAIPLNNLGTLAYSQADMDAAYTYFHQSAILCRQSGDRHSLAHALNGLGITALAQGNFDEAITLLSEYKELCLIQKDHVAAAIALLNLGDAMRETGNVHAALPLLIASERVLERLGHRHKSEASSRIALCIPTVGQERVHSLAKQLNKKSLTELLATEPTS